MESSYSIESTPTRVSPVYFMSRRVGKLYE